MLPAILVFCLISGCASGPQANPTDPLEPLNRSMYSFNEGIDKAVLKPVAQGYRAVTPQPVRAGVSNFFNNLQDLWSGINGVFQLRPVVATDNFLRFGVNTVFGLGGVLDVAGEMGIERHPEDFGKTLGRWGVPSGPYLVLPLFGPSTLRDSTTIVLENKYDAISAIQDTKARNGLTALRIVDTRTNLLRIGNLLDEAALDKYSFTRDAFLQKRRAEIYRPGASNGDDDYKQPAEDKK
ncbi:VacJ family lipoprotein [Variovorax sp. PCZ-1]|uniref:MlaA family lipoprotein n=1 Tax=Variovorax sp. PCZ-1 TaxID=2835533 RepID=UPI0032DFAA1F